MEIHGRTFKHVAGKVASFVIRVFSLSQGEDGLESEEQGGAWRSHLDKKREGCSAERLGEQGTDPLEPGGQGRPDLVNEGGGDLESQELRMTPQPPMASFTELVRQGPQEKVWGGGESELGLKSSLELGFC